jgi:two-component system, cell cycle sensor histidine kinase and response regulator CckA
MPTTPETVLLVDDEPEVRAAVRDVLELSGYTVLEAGDATEAVTVEAGVAGPIHLLLTDVVMPGLSGPDLARRLTPRRPQMKVIYMTGFSLVDIQNQQIGLEPGVPILPKPFRVDVLTKKVRAVLAEPPPFRSNPFAPASPFARAPR